MNFHKPSTSVEPVPGAKTECLSLPKTCGSPSSWDNLLLQNTHCVFFSEHKLFLSFSF